MGCVELNYATVIDTVSNILNAGDVRMESAASQLRVNVYKQTILLSSSIKAFKQNNAADNWRFT